jgi:hypothetical protein
VDFQYNNIIEAVKKRRIRWSDHALEEKRADNLTIAQIKESLLQGEIIEEYPSDKPLPSCLILGFAGNTPIHSVVGFNEENAYIRIITVYIPDTQKFEHNFKIRRKK